MSLDKQRMNQALGNDLSLNGNDPLLRHHYLVYLSKWQQNDKQKSITLSYFLRCWDKSCFVMEGNACYYAQK